jgi:hypothetical protein
VHEAEMLPEMVFAIEGSCFKTFLFAGGVVVRFEMLSGGVQRIAVHAFALARGWACYYIPKRSTDPLL